MVLPEIIILPNGERLETMIYDSIRKRDGFPRDSCDIAMDIDYPIGIKEIHDKAFYRALDNLADANKLEWISGNEKSSTRPGPEDRLFGRLYGLPTWPSRNSTMTKFLRRVLRR